MSSIAYLVSAVALAGVALFMITDATLALIRLDRPTIGTVEVFGHVVWMGWVMLAALLYSVVPPVIFGRLKMRPARELHDKVLWADALMNKADWMTGLAAGIGVLEIGTGWWWADAAAAILIALDVLHDGYRHTTAAVRDLMDEVPRTVDDEEIDPLVARVGSWVDGLPWVEDSAVRLREEGRFLAGSIHVKSRGGSVDAEAVREAEAGLRALHWRVGALSLVPLPNLGAGPSGRGRPDEPGAGS